HRAPRGRSRSPDQGRGGGGEARRVPGLRGDAREQLVGRVRGGGLALHLGRLGGLRRRAIRSAPGPVLTTPPMPEGKRTRQNFVQAINGALRQAMELDPNVFVYGIGADGKSGIFGTTAGLVERFGPKRVFDT